MAPGQGAHRGQIRRPGAVGADEDSSSGVGSGDGAVKKPLVKKGFLQDASWRRQVRRPVLSYSIYQFGLCSLMLGIV